MRTAGNRGHLLFILLLLLLATTAFVAWRRPRDAPARPASLMAPGGAPPGGPGGGGGGGPPPAPGRLWPPDHPPDFAEPEAESDRFDPGGDGGLVFEADEVDLGVLESKEPREVDVPWRRTGAGELGIRTVSTGCGCAVARGLPDRVPEGASGRLVVRFSGRSHAGPFTLWVRVLTDRPPGDLKRLRLRGFVGTATLVAPRAIDLGAVTPDRVVDVSVTVRPPPSRASPRVQALLTGLAGFADVVPPAELRARGSDVSVSVHAPSRPGPFLGWLQVVVGDEGVWRIPIRGTVVATSVPPRTR